MKKRKMAAILTAAMVCTSISYPIGLSDSYAKVKATETEQVLDKDAYGGEDKDEDKNANEDKKKNQDRDWRLASGQEEVQAYRLATPAQAEPENSLSQEEKTESETREENSDTADQELPVSGEQTKLADQAADTEIQESVETLQNRLGSSALDIYVKTIDDEDESNTYYLSECWEDTVCVVVFGSSSCGITTPTVKELNELAADYKEKPVVFLFIDLNNDADSVRTFASSIPNIQVCNDKVSGMGFTYNGCWNTYLDEAGNGANPSRFPHVFIVQDGEVLYRNVEGRVITQNTFAQELNRILEASGEEKPEEPAPIDFEARKQEIVEFYRANPFNLNHTVTFDREPVLKENGYEAGVLRDDTLEDGLNALNFVRFVAGLSADVGINEQYQDYAQKGAVLMHSQDKLDHFIEPCPSGMQEDFYNDAYKGTAGSNIAYGNIMLSPSYNVINQWMYGGDIANNATAAHRRWCLNPDMGSTGYGYSGGYCAMYIKDHSGTPGTEHGYTAWPAQVMPFEYFKGPWTVSLDRRELAFDPDAVVVTLEYEGKTFKFSSADKNSRYLRVSMEETDGQMGSGPAVIFQPDFALHADSVVDVTIEGVKDLDGREQSIQYTVRFFSMNDEVGDSSSGGDVDQEDGIHGGNGSGSSDDSENGSGSGSNDGSGNGSGSGSSDGSGNGSSSGSNDGSGNGSGSGSSDGSGNGSSSGSSDGSGNGSSSGSNDGSGNGSGSGSNDGSGNGSGNGDGSGNGNGSGSSDDSENGSGSGSDDGSGNGSGSGNSSSSGSNSSGSSSGSRKRSSENSASSAPSLPSYVTKGSWTKRADGSWGFTDESGQPYINRWGAVYNPQAATNAGTADFDWYRFDENGVMLTGWYTDPADGRIYYLNPVSDGTMGRMMTGWIMIDGKEYYFNTRSDGLRGRMYQNEETPDGHFVDALGVKVW